MAAEIAPFRIEVTEVELTDLRDRLERTRWPERETVGDWSQGIPLSYVQDVCEYWRTGYDWRRFETELNAIPQFRTTIDGLGIHFLHVRSPHDDALPLLLTHGWPGSVAEFMKVIDPLVDPTRHGSDVSDAFDVVCPSLPGYGFSDKPAESGWGTGRIAGAWAELMARLGYSRYGAHGGDWGAIVTTQLANLDESHLAGIHVTMPVAQPVNPGDGGELTDRRAGGARRFCRASAVGYGLLQAAVDATTDARLLARRLARGTVRVDPGEVLGMDRLRWPPGERPDTRRAARQRDAVLAACGRRLVGAPLLGELSRSGFSDDRRADGMLDLPEGGHPHSSVLGGAAVHGSPHVA